MYAGCVLWPLKLDPWVGWTVGGAVAGIMLIEYLAGLRKRMKQGEAKVDDPGPAGGP